MLYIKLFERISELSLHKSIEANDIDKFKKLIKSNINLNNQNYRGQTAVHYCVYFNKIDMLKELIRSGADLDIQEKDGCTALIIASMNGYLDIIKELLKAGADPFMMYKNDFFYDILSEKDKLSIIHEFPEKLSFLIDSEKYNL